MRLVRALLRALFLTLILALGAGVAAVAVSQTAWFRNWLRGLIVSQSAQFLNGQLSIGRLDGNLFYGLELHNVSIEMDAQPVISLQDVVLRYNAWQLLTQGISIDELRISKPRLSLRADPDGTWQVARLLKQDEQEADRQGPGRPFAVEQIVVVDGEAVITAPPAQDASIPDRVDGLGFVASFAYEPVRYTLSVESFAARSTGPDLNIVSLAGGVAVKDDDVFLEQVSLKTDHTAVTVGGDVQQYLSQPDLHLQLSAPQVSMAEIARFVPALEGVDLQPSIDARVNGPLDALAIELATQSAAGALKASVKADLAAPGQSVVGDLSVQHLNLAPLLRDSSQTSDITGDARIDLVSESFTTVGAIHGTVNANARAAIAGYVADRVDLKATLAAGRPAQVDATLFAYGARATAAGTVSVPDGDTPVRFDIRGRAQRVNLRTLPPAVGAPRATTDLNAAYHVVGSQPMGTSGVPRLTVDAVMARSTVPGARLEEGGTAQLTVVGKALAYKVDATVAAVDLHALGRAFNVPALVDDRYRTVINGHIMADGQGTDPATLDVDATGTITSAELMGGRLTDLEFTGGLHRNDVTLEAQGTFTGFDPAVLSGTPAAAGRVDGEFTVSATAAQVLSGVTLDSVSGDVRATLAPSAVGGLAIERAVVDASYAQRSAIVRDLDVMGRDVHVSARGTLALNDTGSSNLTFRADSPRLEEIGQIFDVPVMGIARVEGTITGNQQLLNVAGTLEGDGLKYEENGALSLRTQFSAEVPQLTLAQARVSADSRATFVTVAGQNINELHGTTRYEPDRVTFDLTARQPQRQLAAAGAVTLHTDHQEVHLDRLMLDTANQQWQVADGSTPTIHYGRGLIGVEHLRLVNGDQTIVADGRFGSAGDALNVQLSNVDLAAIDALLLRPPQFTGRLEATAVVSGTTAAPAVAADFTVASGGFREFTYESFTGHVDYSSDGIALDTRLQQNDTQWISAKGHVPATLFAPASDEVVSTVAGGHVLPATPAERVDLTIDSSPLGLGLIQGFTTALTGVDGTVEAHVRVTGSAADPHPEGTLTIADGIMTVVPNGVTYTNITGKIDLQPDRVHIDQITVLDNHQSALTLTGDLAVHAREVGGVQLWVNASDFKILDNRMGNVRVNSAVEIAGELRAPVLQGDFGISTGRVDLDEMMAVAGASPYSTTQTEFVTAPAATTDEPPAPSLFDALRMNLRLQVPDDLVVRADSLQAPGATIGLGALNVTLGGDLTAMKEPGGPVRLLGQVNTVRGTYDFQGRRFEILRDGTVRFDGTDTLNPVLDVRTRRLIQGVEALVTVRGPLDRPEIVMASIPPLEQADILSLIVFNQPVNQLGEGQAASLSARAQSLAVGAVAGQLAAQIGGALNLDTFEINIGPENGAAAEVTLGQQLGKDLYVKVQQGVGDMTSTNVIVEYSIRQWLRLQTNILQGASGQQSLFRRQQGSGADLIVLFTR